MSVEISFAIYHTHTDADRAVKELQRGGVDMHKLSIVGKDITQMSKWSATTIRRPHEILGKVGAFWGGFWALLFGSAMFVIRARPNFSGWTSSGVDRGRPRRCR